jgi:putative pyruvate formate lyase activating enzyme
MGEAGYMGLYRSGELSRRAEAAIELRKDGCKACPRECGREDGRRGACGQRDHPLISYAAPYFADEQCLVGTGGTGAIFFAGCNLRCSTCKSTEISRQTDVWREVTPEDVASFMISLQARGVENLSLVTPSHVVPEVLSAIDIAAGRGLTLPIIYNTSTYDRVETLRLLDGVVSIYLPDVKFTDPEVADLYTFVSDYAEVARAGIREMHRQVGDLRFDSRGMVTGGLLVRHLVLPEDLGGVADLARFLREEVSPDTCMSILGTYVPPAHLADRPPLNRRPTRDEYLEALRVARKAGLKLLGEESGL